MASYNNSLPVLDKPTNYLQRSAQGFNINGFSRLSYDNATYNTDNIQSQRPTNYILSNFHEKDCAAPVVREAALNNPTILYKDGYGWVAKDGCLVDNDSKVRNAKNLTNMNCPQQLHVRTFTAGPDHSRGNFYPDVESDLREGQHTKEKRPCNVLSGVSIPHVFTPQIPHLEQNVQNPSHIIPEDSKKDWVRGGASSRSIVRNSDFLQRCGYNYNGKYWEKKVKSVRK